MADVFRLRPGTTPLLVSIPHGGTRVPKPVAGRFSAVASGLPDTDWHVERLYAFVEALGASVLAATQSRYVVDLNRDPADTELYPGADNTTVVPTSTFASEPIYRVGREPGPDEVRDRIARYWQPYHRALADHLEQLRARHGVAVLYDAHSIRSRVPRFFEGVLPDFNLGTGGGATADGELQVRAFRVLANADEFGTVLNGRFKGGYITRHYGRPESGVHALQLELAQRTYMDEDPPWTFDAERAERVQSVLRALFADILDWCAARR